MICNFTPLQSILSVKVCCWNADIVEFEESMRFIIRGYEDIIAMVSHRKYRISHKLLIEKGKRLKH